MEKDACRQKTDNELVTLSLQDESWFYCIILRYEEALLRYVRRISYATKEDAEDILQEVFLSVYQNLNDFDSSLKFSSWLYRIAHNKTVSAWRKTNARPKTISTDEDLDLFAFIASDEDILKDLEKKCDAKKTREIIGRMDKKYRDVLVLKFLEDKDYREISDILKKPMGTVATLINRAKKKLEAELNKLEIKS